MSTRRCKLNQLIFPLAQFRICIHLREELSLGIKLIYACLSLKMENERFLQLSQGDKVYRINIKTEYFNIIGSVKSLSFIPPRKVSG